MTDLEVLFLVLVALYLSAAGHWYPGEAALFRSAGKRAWRRTESLAGFRGGKLKVVFADLLPPLHGVAICAELPFRLSPAGLCTSTGEVLSWQDLRFQVVEHRLFSGDLLIGQFRSEHEAGLWRDRLRELAQLAPRKGEEQIRTWLRAGFHAASARERRDDFDRSTRWLRRFTNSMFVWLFVAGPAAVNLLGLGITWLPLLLGVVLLLVLIVRSFLRAHRALYPFERATRFRHVVTMALSPPAAARAADLLLLDLFSGLHPLAVAAVVFNAGDFERYASDTLRALRYPLSEDLSDEAAAIAQWYRRELLRVAEEFAQRRGLDLDAVYAVPEPESPAIVAYCPRCRTQYLSHNQSCADCVGVELHPLPTPVGAAIP